MSNNKSNIDFHLSTALSYVRPEMQKAEHADSVARPLAQKMKEDAEQMMEQARELTKKAQTLFDEARQLECTTDWELKQWQTIMQTIERARDELLWAPSKEEKE